MKKFYAVVGNPPYQEENQNSSRQPSVYPVFMREAYRVGERVELITPARFLFDEGLTKKWSKEALRDPHLKILEYESDAKKIFPTTGFKGGVVITLRDITRAGDPIGVFTPYEELNSIIEKVCAVAGTRSKSNANYMDSIVSSRGNYRFTEKFSEDFPDAISRLGKGTGNMFASNFFERIPECASETPHAGKLKFLCRVNGKRTLRYVDERYVIHNPYTDTYNVAFPEGNGGGVFGEALSASEVLHPGECATDTFLSVGLFRTQGEAENLITYIRTKFFRTMLGVKKGTQHTPSGVWSYIPLQDFSSSSDIDWSQSVANIDGQLYTKYGLSDEEIEFIESHVKEMD